MHTTRRRLIQTAGAVIGLPTVPQMGHLIEFQWRIGHSAPATFPIHQRLLEAAETIAKQADGRMTLTVVPADELGGEVGMLAQTRDGKLEMSLPSGRTLGLTLPIATIHSIGFAFPNYDAVWRAMDGKLGEYVRAQISKSFGVMALQRMWDFGFRQMTSRTKAIDGSADLSGMTMAVRLAPADFALFKALGAAPVPMPLSSVVQAVRQHRVDATNDTLAVTDVEHISQVHKHCALTNHVWEGHWLCANPTAWGDLPDDLRAMVADTLNEAALNQRADTAAADQALQVKLAADGMAFTKPELESFRAALRGAGVYDDWRNRMGKEPMAMLTDVVGRLD
jgi:tripartite ATP-independent transporter DctP family solute receptor